MRRVTQDEAFQTVLAVAGAHEDSYFAEVLARKNGPEFFRHGFAPVERPDVFAAVCAYYAIRGDVAVVHGGEVFPVSPCGANVDHHHGGGLYTHFVCALPKGHDGDHNTSEDGDGDIFPNHRY